MQEIKKYDIYLIFKENDGTQPYHTYYKFANKNGINFNLNHFGFLHKRDFKRDTIDLNEIYCLPIIEERDIEILEKEFREKNHAILMKKYLGGYPPYDRSFIFNVFIIEKVKDSLVVYEAIFRNEGIQK